MSEKTVTINGTMYDAHTGMPLASAPKVQTAKPAMPPQSSSSQTVHRATQRSQTLNRRIVKKATVSPQPMRRPAAHQNPAVMKFAPHPSSQTTKQTAQPMSDIGPITHPLVAKVQKHHPTAAPATAPKPSHIIKQEAIASALEKAPSHTKNTKQHKNAKKHPRFLSIASASLALLLLGSYFTYLNMPSLSVRVAAAQAGVNASYPEYRPDGYSLNGPIAYSDGEVSMKFASNGGPQNFTVAQAKSSWDSSAVLDNYVKQKAGDNYIAYNERGLTIYTFDGNAAWVNSGVLFTVTGNAPLSSDQIRRIAASM